MRFAICLIASLAFGQSPPQFDLATIKLSAAQTEGRTQTRMSSDTDTGRLTYSNVNLKEVIARAYKVQESQVTGPGFIITERFDINAQFPPHTDGNRVPLMLQALLADRFKLTVHRETKELPIYALVVAKGGPKFKPSDTSTGVVSDSSRSHWHVTAKITMPRFAEFLTDEAGRPVVDKTNLTGAYDLTLDWAADTSTNTNDSSSGPSLFTALQEQLGLKLDPTKGPVETIVVDHAEKAPTPD